MKNIKYLLFAVIAVVTAFSAASCTDGNDWDITDGPDGQYNRLFTPSSVSVSTSGGVSTISWSTYDAGDYYVIEICNAVRAIADSIPEGVVGKDCPGYDEAKYKKFGCSYDVVLGRDGSITGKSYQTTLDPGTYQLRIKACSTQGKKESNWLYFTKDNDVFFEIGGGESEEEEE